MVSRWFLARCLPELVVVRGGTSVVFCPTLLCAGGTRLKIGSGRYWWSVVGLPWCLNFRSSSSSLFTSLSHMASALSAGLESTFSSKHDSLVFSHERLDDSGGVLRLLSGILAFLP